MNWQATLAMITRRPHGTQAAAAIDEIERIVQEEEIQCEFTRAPGYLHVCADGFSDKELSSLKKEARVGAKLGFGATYLERIPYFSVPGVRFPNQAKFHPRKYLRSLVMKLSASGSHVFEKSAVTEFDAEKRRAKVNGHWIGFDRVVIATNNPLVGLASITERDAVADEALPLHELRDRRPRPFGNNSRSDVLGHAGPL